MYTGLTCLIAADSPLIDVPLVDPRGHDGPVLFPWSSICVRLWNGLAPPYSPMQVLMPCHPIGKQLFLVPTGVEVQHPCGPKWRKTSLADEAASGLALANPSPLSMHLCIAYRLRVFSMVQGVSQGLVDPPSSEFGWNFNVFGHALDNPTSGLSTAGATAAA